jgi:hypothetical protein
MQLLQTHCKPNASECHGCAVWVVCTLICAARARAVRQPTLLCSEEHDLLSVQQPILQTSRKTQPAFTLIAPCHSPLLCHAILQGQLAVQLRWEHLTHSRHMRLHGQASEGCGGPSSQCNANSSRGHDRWPVVSTLQSCSWHLQHISQHMVFNNKVAVNTREHV